MKQKPSIVSPYLSVFFLLLFLTFSPRAFSGEKEVELEPIVVSLEQFQGAGEIPTRDIKSINPRKEPAVSIEQILDCEGAVDISRRGIFGIQSDLGIRGATSEQTAVSLNGIGINNPQTAHHNLDLPMPLSAVRKIEVAGAASPYIWGQGAMGGAVNIVTKRPLKNEAEASFLYGSDETHRSSFHMSRNNGLTGLNFSAEEAASNGWRYDTDFRELSLASSGLFKPRDDISSHIFVGYGEKEFGAANFYGLYNSKEWTNGLFLNGDTEIEKGRFKITPKLYYKKHYDKYMLDIARPNYYLNHHKTAVEGVQLEVETDLSGWGLFLTAADFKRERIKSTQFQKHSRSKDSISFACKNYKSSFFGYDASLLIDDYSEYDAEFSPQAGVYFMLSPHLKLRSSVSRSTRPPTYTELYYDSPANKGSRDLTPEKAMNYEAGIDLSLGGKKRAVLSATVFRRDSSDSIDWIKEAPAQSYYQARNITEVKTAGVETGLDIKLLEWLTLRGDYCYIDSDIKKDADYISKYALNHPYHKVVAAADIVMPFGTQNINLLYKDRKNYAHYFTMGCNFNYELSKNSSLFLNIDNIFNSTYYDIKDNTLPGRQIAVGSRVKF